MAFHHHPRIVRAAALGQVFSHSRKQTRRNRQVVQRILRLPQLRTQLRKSMDVVVVAIYIAQQAHQLLKGLGMNAAMLLNAVLGASLQLVQIPAGLGHADDRQFEALIADQPLQRRKNLFVRQVARSAQKHKCIGMNRCHQSSPEIRLSAANRSAKFTRPIFSQPPT